MGTHGCTLPASEPAWSASQAGFIRSFLVRLPEDPAEDAPLLGLHGLVLFPGLRHPLQHDAILGFLRVFGYLARLRIHAHPRILSLDFYCVFHATSKNKKSTVKSQKSLILLGPMFSGFWLRFTSWAWGYTWKAVKGYWFSYLRAPTEFVRNWPVRVEEPNRATTNQVRIEAVAKNPAPFGRLL